MLLQARHAKSSQTCNTEAKMKVSGDVQICNVQGMRMCICMQDIPLTQILRDQADIPASSLKTPGA